MLTVKHKLNAAAEVTLGQNAYDETGRLLTKTRAGEQSRYSYNVRGRLTQVAGAKFSQTLAYNAAVNGLTPAANFYGGNIGAMK